MEKVTPGAVRPTYLPYFAKMVAIMDCYDAITSARVYDGHAHPWKRLTLSINAGEPV